MIASSVGGSRIQARIRIRNVHSSPVNFGNNCFDLISHSASSGWQLVGTGQAVSSDWRGPADRRGTVTSRPDVGPTGQRREKEAIQNLNEGQPRTWNRRLRRLAAATGGPATRPSHLDEVAAPSVARTSRTTTTQATRSRRAGNSAHRTAVGPGPVSEGRRFSEDGSESGNRADYMKSRSAGSKRWCSDRLGPRPAARTCPGAVRGNEPRGRCPWLPLSPLRCDSDKTAGATARPLRLRIIKYWRDWVNNHELIIVS